MFFSTMLFLRNFERFNNLHSYHGRVGGNQLPPISLLLPRMTGCNMRPPVIYFPNWPPLRLRRAHYFRMRDHGSSLFSAVKNLHFFKLRVTEKKEFRSKTLLIRAYSFINAPFLSFIYSWRCTSFLDNIFPSRLQRKKQVAGA